MKKSLFIVLITAYGFASGQLSDKFKKGINATSNLTTLVTTSTVYAMAEFVASMGPEMTEQEKQFHADTVTRNALVTLHGKMSYALDSIALENKDFRDTLALIYEDENLHKVLDSLENLPRHKVKGITEVYTLEDAIYAKDILISIVYKRPSDFDPVDVAYVQAAYLDQRTWLETKFKKAEEIKSSNSD